MKSSSLETREVMLRATSLSTLRGMNGETTASLAAAAVAIAKLNTMAKEDLFKKDMISHLYTEISKL